MVKCPECGAAIGTNTDSESKMIDGIVKKATNTGNKLKSLKPARVRPDAIKGGKSITRGGRYASD